MDGPLPVNPTDVRLDSDGDDFDFTQPFRGPDGQFCTAADAAKRGDKRAIAKLQKEKDDEAKDAAAVSADDIVTAGMNDVTKIKLPAWQAEEPAFWFELADTQFGLYDPAPTEKQKSALAAAIIPISTLKPHRTALQHVRPYTALKEAICGATTKSDVDLCNMLLAAKLAPDDPPSEFLRRGFTVFAEVKGANGKPMTTAAQVQGWLMKQLLERQLPPVVASAMVDVNLETTDEVQAYMDKVDRQHKTFRANQSAMVAAVADNNDVAAIRPAKRGQAGKRTGGARIGGKDGKCYFHTRFGDKARSCEGECSERGKPLTKKTA